MSQPSAKMTDVNNDSRSDRGVSAASNTDTAKSSTLRQPTQPRPTQPRPTLRRLIIGLGVIAVTCVSGYFLQQLVLPDVDLEKTRPVVVGETDSGSAGGDLNSATPSPNLP